MLISVEVKNFRSFYDKTIFSMETGYKLRKYSKTNIHNRNIIKVVKSAFIFGGNANGKTNIINIFVLLRALILRPTMSEVDRLITDTFAGNSEPTHFIVKFLKNTKLFIYELEYVEERVIRESLTVNNTVIFSRDEQSLELPDELTGLKQTIRKNQVLLFFAQSNNISEAKEAFEWFAMDVIIPTMDYLEHSHFEKLKNDKALKERLIAFLQAADFNIVDIELREKTRKPATISVKREDEEEVVTVVERKLTEVYCVHQDSDDTCFVLNLEDESAGTKIFLLLAVDILKNKAKDKVFFIDEFDASLHIKLTKVLLNLFNKWNAGSQFVVTTHSFDLMDQDLRSDQIFFVEKDRYGKSEIYSLFDFDDPALKRHDYNYKCRYMQGIYGADQIVNYAAIADALGVDYE